MSEKKLHKSAYAQSDSFLGEAPRLEQTEFITINEDCEVPQATKHKNEARRAYIGLGSNLKDPMNQVLHAIESIAEHPNINLIAQSSLYQTQPVGPIEQPDFINAVIHIETSLPPHDLLTELLKIEQQQGRERTVRFGPRTLDLDILLYDDLTIQSENLTIPHPRLHERAFVLHPIFEIAPDLKILGCDPNIFLKNQSIIKIKH